MTARTQTRILRICTLLTVEVAMSACLIQPFEADCPGKSSCESCMGESGCGWCSSDEDLGWVSAYGEGRCLPGTSLGPADEGACRLTHWFYAADCLDPVCDNSCDFANDGTCDEPDTCDRGTDCTDCREPGDAAVLEDDNRCMQSTDCESCMGNPAGCGWCSENGGQCRSGGTDGPYNAACDPGSWHRFSCPSDTTQTCLNTCRYAYDGECDEPMYCDYGTDCADCSQ